jgi:hypothetical protein
MLKKEQSGHDPEDGKKLRRPFGHLFPPLPLLDPPLLPLPAFPPVLALPWVPASSAFLALPPELPPADFCAILKLLSARQHVGLDPCSEQIPVLAARATAIHIRDRSNQPGPALTAKLD